MNMKKWILTGACISMLGLYAACSSDSGSEDEQNPVTPGDDPALSSGGDQPQSQAGTGSSSPAAGGSSSSMGSSIYSSSMTDSDEPQMACSEIMYNAADGSDLEWVEVYIAGGMDMDNMQNFELHLSGAVDFTFPAEPLKKGEYVVITNNPSAFASAYPNFAGRVFGPWNNPSEMKLVNEGDVVNVKLRGEGDVSCAFSNEPPWPSLADGKGRSLVFKGGNAAQSVAWCASKAVGGNPGVGDDACVDASNTVRINEIQYYDPANGGSWLELFNSGDTDVDVSGWTVEVKRRKDMLKIASGVVPAKGYLVLDGKTGFDSEFIVNDQGGEVYLKGLVEGQESSIWMPAGAGTAGVVDLSDASTAQGPLSLPTPGAANSALRLGTVYIEEIHYHPSETDVKNLNFEFMEIVNKTDAPITLYNSTLNKPWKIEGINMTFASSDIIPAKGRMILLPDSLKGVSKDILTGFKVDASVPVVFYKGKLSNRGETIAIKEPYAKEGVGVDEKVFYLWHDATLYSDCWPELKDADGYGFSLHRVDINTMGYEASAWKAAEPTFGN